MHKFLFLIFLLTSIGSVSSSLEENLGTLKNSLETLNGRLVDLQNGLNRLSGLLSGKEEINDPFKEPHIQNKGLIDYLEIPENDEDLPFSADIKNNFANTSVFEKFYQYFKVNYLNEKILFEKCKTWSKYPEHYKPEMSDEEFINSLYSKIYKQYESGQKFIDKHRDTIITLRKNGLNLFNHFKQALDTIGRACFEKYVLDACLAYINKNDPDRIKSGEDEQWVYKNFLKEFIKSNLINADENNILKNAAELTIQSADDMYFHAERDPNDDNPLNVNRRDFVWCHCLLGRLLGYQDISDKETKALMSINPLLYPICYLIYETMHITLNHNYFLINKLVHLFNWNKKCEISKKVSFHVGFDQAFGEIINLLVDDEETVKKNLLIETQKKIFGDKKEVLLRDEKPRSIIYGKKREQTLADDPPNPSNRVYHDTKDAYQWEQLSATQNHIDIITSNDLLYAIKLHLDRHSCYSVGLIPRDLVEMINWPIEKEIKKTEIIAKYIINKKEKERLEKEAKKLRRIVAIGTVLSGVGMFKKGYEGAPTRLETIRKESKNKNTSSRKAQAFHELFTELIQLDSYFIKEDNTTPQQANITFQSITKDEWDGVFAYLKSILNQSPDGKPIDEKNNLAQQQTNIQAVISSLREQQKIITSQIPGGDKISSTIDSMRDQISQLMSVDDKKYLEYIYAALDKHFPEHLE